ncbi:MAG: MBL fold metallo-hydrolase [Promethearchaeota archaeon]
MNISKNTYLVGSEELSGAGDCMVYAIRLKKGTTCLIDSGTSHASQIIKNMEDVSLKKEDLKYLILTHAHYDHSGAAFQFRKLIPNLEIIAHEKDVPTIEGAPETSELNAASWYGATYTPVKVDIVLRNPVEELVLDGTTLKVYHTPGHTPGSISILLKDDDKKILFGQDIHGPFLKEFKSSIHDWKKSMKLLLSLNADILCEGHFGVYKGKTAVKEYINSYLKKY